MGTEANAHNTVLLYCMHICISMHTWTWYRTFLRLFVAWLHKSSVRISIHTSPSASVQRKDDEIPRHYVTSVSQKHTHAMKMECKGFVQVHVKLKPFLGHECSNP